MRANSGLRRSKYNYINNNIVNSSGDPKRFRRQVRVLVPNVSSQPIDTIMSEDGVTPLREVAACNRINEYFCNISATLSSKLKKGIPWTDPCNIENRSEIWSFEISEDEVLKLLDDTNEEKASGFFCITSNLLKRILKIIISQFTVLLNLVLKKISFSGWLEDHHYYGDSEDWKCQEC